MRSELPLSTLGAPQVSEDDQDSQVGLGFWLVVFDACCLILSYWVLDLSILGAPQVPEDNQDSQVATQPEQSPSLMHTACHAPVQSV